MAIQRIVLPILFTLWIDLLVISSPVDDNSFNNELMPRITERLDDFFVETIRLNKYYVRYFDRMSKEEGEGGASSIDLNRTNDDRNIGFSPKRTLSINRQALFKDLFAQAKAASNFFNPFSMSFSFEDGIRIFAEEDNTRFYFGWREPGEAGYVVDSDNQQFQTDPNYKYWISCFDSINGTSQNCSLVPGKDQFVTCINNCELIPCKRSNESIFYGSNETIWCRNYETKNYTEGDGQRGYIPYAKLCTNRRGEPDQRIGYVIDDVADDKLGNCYYGDQRTLVNRSLAGDYFACGGNGEVCDNAYHGAYFQFHYDHRYREFYVTMKDQPLPRWRGPATLVGGFNPFVAFEHPYFTTINDSNTTRRIFEGMGNARYYLYEISQFLRAEYAETDYLVLIVSRDSPNIMIATSYHEEQFQLKAVLTEDETKPCNDPTFLELLANQTKLSAYQNASCKTVQIPISDLNNSIKTEETISYRAFIAQQDQNFPPDKPVYVKLSDKIGSSAFTSLGRVYKLPEAEDTMEWHVLAITPMNRSPTDAALPGDISFVIICLASSIGFMSCLGCLLVFTKQAYKPIPVHVTWKLSFAFMLGCTTLNLSSFTLLGENTDLSCMLRMWIFHALFACMLSPLFVEAIILVKIINKSSNVEITPLTINKTVLYVLPLIVTQLFILTIFSFVDPPRQDEQLGVGSDTVYQQITCKHETKAFVCTQTVFTGLLILAGCVLAYRIRKIDPKYGLSKQIAFCFYNITLVGSVIAFALILIDFDPESLLVIQALGVLFVTFFCCFAFIVPILLRHDEKKSSQALGTGSKTSYTRTKPMSQYASSSLPDPTFSSTDGKNSHGLGSDVSKSTGTESTGPDSRMKNLSKFGSSSAPDSRFDSSGLEKIQEEKMEVNDE